MGNVTSKQKIIPNCDSVKNTLRSKHLTFSLRASKRSFKETYTLAKDLGTGAFSVVKLAVHKGTGKSAAVKIVSKNKLSEDDLDALMTEISILSELNHPHIIKCYETFDEGNEIYIVTELVAGGELFDRIVAKTQYTEKEARDLVRTLLETMAYMHDVGIVHRDLKPENLLLCSETDDSDIKIADFGFAKKTADLLPSEMACGTPGYVAPEVLRGDQYGSEVDIWSLGVVCYVLLVGYPPFYDEDQRKLFKKIKEGRYHFHEDYWGGISPGATDMIRKMLCVDQSERWSARQLLEHSWIVTDDEELMAKDLTRSIIAMRKFKAKMRFKAAAKAIIATKRMMKGMAKSLQPTVKPAASSSYLPAIDIHQKVSHRVVNSIIDTSSHVPHTLPSIRLHTTEQQIEQSHVHGYENAHVKIHTPRPEYSQNDTEIINQSDHGERGIEGRNEEEIRRERDNKMHEKICNDQIHRMKEKEKERVIEKERKKNSEQTQDIMIDKKKVKVGGEHKDIEKGRERGKERDSREGAKLQEIFSDKKVSQFEDNLLIKERFIQCNRSPVSVSTVMSMSVPESAECSAPGTPRSTIPILSFPNGKFVPLLPKEENNSENANECVSVSANVSASASDTVLRMEIIGNKSPRTN